MKQYLLNVCILFVCIAFFTLVPKKSYGQLNGTSYTINPAKAASSTNYKNWASAVGDLVSGSRSDGGTAKGPGVSGAVTFSVYDTLYASNVSITAITGSSATNRITFKSAKGDSSKCRLQYASSTSSTDDYVLLLDGADFITFQQIGFERTGSNTFNTVVQITNDADNNKFIRCQMTGIKAASDATNSFGYLIGACIYFAGNGDSTEINGNRLLYGYNGILNLTAAAGLKIYNNKIDTSGSAGVYVASQTNLRIIGNLISLGDFGTTGHYTSYGMRVEGSPSLDISNNKLYLLAYNAQVARGIVLISIPSPAKAPAMVYNNWVLNNAGTTSPNCNGLACYGCDYVNFYFNNVLITNTMTDGSAYFHNSTTSTFINLKNNNFINKGGGYAISTPGTDLDSVNYNNVYTSGTYIANWGGGTIKTFASWQTGSGKNANSWNIDPSYYSNANMHISNFTLKGKGIPYYRIKFDIDGDLRDAATPTIGADELLPLPNDAGIVGINKPLANVCGAVLPVEAIIKNYGTSKLTKATINWSVNGVAQTPYSYTGNLLTNKQDTVTIGTYNFTTVLSPKFILKSALPNGQTDGFLLNDSIIIVRLLKGPPTVNAGADFGICLGDSTLIGPVNNPTNSYKWMTMSNTVFATTSQTYVKPTSKTSYIIEAKSNSFGCIARDTIAVDVNSKPVADAGSDATICLGLSAQIGKPAQSGFSYSWTSSPSGFSSTTANPIVQPTTTTTYTIEKTITATGCKATDFAVVTVKQPPTPKVTGTSTLCKFEQASYTTTANTGSSYKWSLAGGGQILNGQSTNTLKVRWNVADTLLLKVIETNAATCKDSSTLSVIVIDKPKASFLAADVCKGTTTNFNNTSIDAVANAWQFGDGGTSTQTNPTHLYATATIFSVRLIVGNSYNCADTAYDVAVVNPIPVANFGWKKTAEKTFDFNDSSTIATGTINKWHWEFGDGDSSSVKTPNHLYTAAGSFDVKLCVTSFAGCKNCTTKNYNVVGLFNPAFSNRAYATPNPGTGIFKINSVIIAQLVIVTNISGQVIATLKPLSDTFNLDLSAQPQGIYFVKIISDNQNNMLKLIKQ